ncbi:MAG: discoidin domain-containing protein, partial [Solirubrobacteraceae bacterium]
MRARRLFGLLALVGALAVGAAALPGPAAATSGPPTLSDGEKKALILDVLERFVPHAEEYWRDESDPAKPWSGYFAAPGPGVTQPRGAGNMAIAYTTLLLARPEQQRFAGVPREVMLEHVIETIRHEAHTNRLAGGSWGGGTWQAALETYGWAFAAHLLWDRLDADTRQVVEQIVTGEADILLTKPPATATAGNTGAEDNAWNAPLPALAAVMFPDHPNRAAWEERTKLLAINSSSRAADEGSTEVVDGRPVSDWVETVNLFDDFTLENHGFFNPIYLQVTHLLVNDAAVIYGRAGRPLPKALGFRFPEVWGDVLGPLAADDGDLVMPAGQDWTSKDYQHLGYLTTLATRLGRADASVAESRALELVARRQATHDDGSILGQPQLGYESHLIKRLTFAYWTHELFGPSPQPTADEYEQAREETGGVRQFPDAEVVIGRQRDALVTMSWDDARPMGLVVPAATGHADDPIFSAYTPGSAIGSASGAVGDYSCDCREDRFSTAGSIGSRRFSMTVFPDGMTMLLDRGEGRTFSFSFELIPGLTGPRPVLSAGGTGTGELDGSWANVADRFGLAVAGGDGLRAQETWSGNPHLRLDGSRGPTNYALNAPITSSSNQPPYPPQRANDGNVATFWVSQNPATPTAPQWLEVDLGRQREVSHLEMTPRPDRFGPRNIVWQVPDGDGGWRDVATAVAERSGPTSVTIDAVRTRRVRLLATSGYDPRNVQVAELVVGSTGTTGIGNRGAAVYPLLDAAETERLSSDLRQPSVPDGWSALVARAPDATGRLAIARWSGPERATLELGTERGAPLITREATVEGDRGVAGFELDAPESQGETVRFFVRSDAPIATRATSGHHAVLTNNGSR